MLLRFLLPTLHYYRTLLLPSGRAVLKHLGILVCDCLHSGRHLKLIARILMSIHIHHHGIHWNTVKRSGTLFCEGDMETHCTSLARGTIAALLELFLGMAWYDGIVRIETDRGWFFSRAPPPIIPRVLAVDTHDLTTRARVLVFAVLYHSGVLFQLDPCTRTWALAVTLGTREAIRIRRACMSLAFDICPVVRCCSCYGSAWLDDARSIWWERLSHLCRCGASVVWSSWRTELHAECETCHLRPLEFQYEQSQGQRPLSPLDSD